MNPYQRRIESLLPAATEALKAKGVPLTALSFSSPHHAPRCPTDARSEFLANRAMGDWAESLLREALRDALPSWRVVAYGNADAIVAGDERFPAFYKSYHEELAHTGKRPDLLIFPSSTQVVSDIRDHPREQLLAVAGQAASAIEVRSSKFFALKYEEERKAQMKGSARQCQSFTPKTEDLRLVKRWIDTFGVPHHYVQVFLDSVYAISFEGILEVLAQGEGAWSIERNARNQDKPTIHVPVTAGRRVALFKQAALFQAETRVTRLGRLDAYVVPRGGELEVDLAAALPALSLSTA